MKGVKEALIDSKVVDREAEALSAADQAAATEVRPSQQDEEVAVHAKEVAHQLHTMNTHRRELALIVEAAGETERSVFIMILINYEIDHCCIYSQYLQTPV